MLKFIGTIQNRSINCLCIIICLIFFSDRALACSTIKLQYDNELLYGHNLNNNEWDVPGLAFINKRGVLKAGRSWSELITKEKNNPSDLKWISRYGSVTFNTFGKDLPDGGMNEAGLYIWEMGLDTEYPKNDSLPALSQMNWMQFILDNYSTVDEAIKSASDIEIDGWGWHFFVADAKGDCAAVEFIDGKVVISRHESMPVPVLMNIPYSKELELLRYYKGFGGLYEPKINDPEVTRFAKMTNMLKNYQPSKDPVADCFTMLKNITVTKIPDWSVVFDVQRQNVYFKTNPNPEIKYFSMSSFDFSNTKPAQTLNISIRNGGDVTSLFHDYQATEVKAMLESLPVPAEFWEAGGIKKSELFDRMINHNQPAESAEYQLFAGNWLAAVEKEGDKPKWAIRLKVENGAVSGEVTHSSGLADKTPLEHISLIGKNLSFTFRGIGDNKLYQIKSEFSDKKMTISLYDIEGFRGKRDLYKTEK